MLMAVAGSVSLLFARLNWPKAIGYIIAGILLSGRTWGGSFLADESSVAISGQIGVVFLMFSTGLGLSTSRLREVAPVALPVAIIDVVAMMWLGFTVARGAFGWGAVPALFLGAAVCDSATTLLAKTIDEMRWSDRPFVRYALGASVFEDIACVGVIALVTGVANGAGMDFPALARSMGALAVFFTAVLFFGLALVPRLLDSIAKRADPEAQLLTLLGLCFFVTYIAYRLEFSLALGAFLVGVLGAASVAREKLAALVEPLKTMFAAVFFVSVGLMVDPLECWRHLPAILAVAALVMCGKLANCTFGALAGGASVKTAVQTGFALAQTGEFAYMTALLYVTITGDTRRPLFQIAVGASLLTTILNPLMIRVSGRAGDFAEKHFPARARRILDGYRSMLERYRTSGASVRRAVVRRALVQISVSAVLVFAVSVACTMLESRDWSHLSRFFDAHKRLFFAMAMNTVIVVIFVATVKSARTMAAALSETLVGAGEARWQNAVRALARLVTVSAVVLLALAEVAMVNVNLAPAEPWARWTIAAAFAVACLFGWRFFARAGRRAAKNFAAALAADERLARLSKEITISLPEDSIARVAIGEDSPVAGFTVGSLGVRAKTGATIAAVDRDGMRIRNVGPALVLRAGDTLVAMGDRAQIAQLKSLVENGL